MSESEKLGTYLRIVDECIAEVSERVNEFEVVDDLETRDRRVERVTIRLQLSQGVLESAAIAQVDVEAEVGIAHLSKLVCRRVNTRTN